MKRTGMSTGAVAFVLALGTFARAQEGGGAAGKGFEAASRDVAVELQAGLTELATLRESIAAEKIPLARELRELEAELMTARGEYQQVSRTLDGRTLDLATIRTEIQSRRDEISYVSNLLGEYSRNFESRLHVAELQRYRSELEAAKLAAEKSSSVPGALSEQEVLAKQTQLLSISLDRLQDALGGTRFPGTAVDDAGLVRQGTFAMLGPCALFRSDDGTLVGTAEQRLGSLEPAVIAFANPLDTQAAGRLFADGSGEFPVDPTLGNAHKIESTEETLWEHIKAGGPVMVPIFALAGAALLVVLYKWSVLAFVRVPSSARIQPLLDAVDLRDTRLAAQRASEIPGPVGRMLATGVEHLSEPRELVEEVMYEQVLSTRLRLQRWLPFVSISASSAPLLGLLGTVTGIMNTFTLITVFGTGDVKTLSSGISEALITTEYGLIVAIPSLLIHALLSRKARGIVDEMEKAAIALLNQVSKSRTPLLERVA
jgi:biopolymer transport protein ExbB